MLPPLQLLDARFPGRPAFDTAVSRALLTQVAAGETGVGDAQQRWIFIGGLAVTAVVTIWITRIARRALVREAGV